MTDFLHNLLYQGMYRENVGCLWTESSVVPHGAGGRTRPGDLPTRVVRGSSWDFGRGERVVEAGKSGGSQSEEMEGEGCHGATPWGSRYNLYDTAPDGVPLQRLQREYRLCLTPMERRCTSSTLPTTNRAVWSVCRTKRADSSSPLSSGQRRGGRL